MSITADIVTEKQFQQAVIEMALRLNWIVYHTFNSRRSVPGFPDIVAVHRTHGVLWIELKTMKGQVSRHQQQWIDALRAVGERAFIVRPDQMGFLESMFRGEEPKEVAA